MGEQAGRGKLGAGRFPFKTTTDRLKWELQVQMGEQGCQMQEGSFDKPIIKGVFC